MPITRRPKSSNGVTISKPDIDALIRRGGSPSRGSSNGKDHLSHTEEAQFILRIPKRDLSTVDDVVSRRRVRISRNRWILEAIADKILRESSKSVSD